MRRPSEVRLLLRHRLLPTCVALLATGAIGAVVRAQDDPARSSVRDGARPPDPRSAAALSPTIRTAFLLETIRRQYERPAKSPRNGADTSVAFGADPLPNSLVPLSPALWIDTVFKGQDTNPGLLPAIVRSRSAALIYYGLFSLDAETRTWLDSQPRLVAEVAESYAGAFVVVAPALRIRAGRVEPPGGPAAAAAWEDLVGKPLADPFAFTRALVARDDGRLGFFFAAMAQLTPGELRGVLRLDAPERTRIEAIRRLRSTYDRILVSWNGDEDSFRRPNVDPVLLAVNLRHHPDGTLVIPGTRRFWRSVLAAGDERNAVRDVATSGSSADREAVDFPSLCERILSGHRALDRERFELVLLVSRLSAADPRWSTPEAIPIIRASRRYPAIFKSLERAGLTDLEIFGATVRRADSIATIKDQVRALRTLTQFQGTFALVLRAADRRATPRDDLARSLTSLAAVDLTEHGDYDGRLVAWFETWLVPLARDAGTAPWQAQPRGPLDSLAIAALSGASGQPRFVDWEGARYRLDFAAAEGARIAQHLGRDEWPFLSVSRTLVALATSIERNGLTAEAAAGHVAALDALLDANHVDPAAATSQGDPPRAYREARATLHRAAQGHDVRKTQKLTALLRGAADELFAQGVLELVYAVALGQRDRTMLTASQAASRHDFSARVPAERTLAWDLPAPVSHPAWHVTGALLGLDVALAEFGLRRLSSKPLAQRPSLSDDQRRVFVQATAMLQPERLTDADRDAIVSALRAGRERLASARTAGDAAAIADAVRLSPLRRTLLVFAVSSDRGALDSFLSLTELLWLGRGEPSPASWNAWGALGLSRSGCLCLQIPERQLWDPLTGRLHSGAIASTFPDLNLRIAELLAEMQMPAALLAAILPAATVDLLDNAAQRDPDDRQGLVEFVRGLRRERLEDYLALLAADGPLIPVDPGDAR